VLKEVAGDDKITVSVAAADEASGLSSSSDVIVMATEWSSRDVSLVSVTDVDDALAATNRSSWLRDLNGINRAARIPSAMLWERRCSCRVIC